MMRKRRQGMTLIEVTVALGVIALAASMWTASVAIQANLTQQALNLHEEAERLQSEVVP